MLPFDRLRGRGWLLPFDRLRGRGWLLPFDRLRDRDGCCPSTGSGSGVELDLCFSVFV